MRLYIHTYAYIDMCIYVYAEDVEMQGAIRHSGVLRKKKENHGRFEDPYKVTCLHCAFIAPYWSLNGA
jgi:hypothetical protein